MIIPHTQAHLAGPLAAFAARMAATAHLPDDQLHWRPERAAGPSRPIARQLRPAPRSSRQFAHQLSTQVARDRRLSPRCAALATVLVAQAGKGTLANVTRAYLARALQVSVRTVARLLSELREHGYVVTSHRLGSLGQTTGLKVELLDPLLPYWQGTGDTAVTPIKVQILTNLLPQPTSPDGHRVKGLQDGMQGSGAAPFRPPGAFGEQVCTNRSR